MYCVATLQRGTFSVRLSGRTFLFLEDFMNTKFIRILTLLVSVTILLSSCLNLEFFNGVPASADTSEITQDLTETSRQKETEKETEGQTTAPSTETNPIAKKDFNFIINKSTGKFHSPTCHYVDMMNEENKDFVSSTRQNLVDEGFAPCLQCQ